MRKYQSKRQRACDFCRARKSACRINGGLPCRLCALHGKQCTFVESPNRSKRATQLGSRAANLRRPMPSTDQGEVSPSTTCAVSPEDQNDIFLPSPTDFQSADFLNSSDQPFLYDDLAEHFFGNYEDDGADLQLDQAGLRPTRALAPELHLARTDAWRSTDWLDARSTGIQLDTLDGLHPQTLGHSGDMDPFLLQSYQYDQSEAYKFKQLSIHSVSKGLVPIQFLFSESGLFEHSRNEMGLHHTPADVSREELESLVPLEIGLRLITLFRRFIMPQCPIFSDLQFPDPQSSPPHLLAAIYMIAQPFSRLDDLLSIELAYDNLNTQGLLKLIEKALHWEAHDPSLPLVQTMLLLVLRPSTNPLVLESSSKWSSHGTLVTVCQTLGLHYDPSSWNIAPWQISLRRRISSVVFSLDKWLAASLGRPPLITRDTWLVTSLTTADGCGSSMSPEVWSEYVVYTRLGPILGDTLSGLYSIKAINDLPSNLPQTMNISKDILDSLSGWHQEFSNLPDAPSDEAAPLHTVNTLGYHYVRMTIFRAIIRPFIADYDMAMAMGVTGPARDRAEVMNFARSGVRSATTSAANFVKNLREEHFHMFWPHWSQVALSSICFLNLMMATSSQGTEEATAWFRDLHDFRKEMRLKSNMLPVLRLGLLRIDAIFWKGVDNVLRLQPHVKEALEASLQSNSS